MTLLILAVIALSVFNAFIWVRLNKVQKSIRTGYEIWLSGSKRIDALKSDYNRFRARTATQLDDIKEHLNLEYVVKERDDNSTAPIEYELRKRKD